MEGMELKFGSVFLNKKVIVTGNTGFKGAWLTVWLLKLGAKVVGISKDVPTDPSMFYSLDLKNKLTHYEQDIRDLGGIKKIFTEEKPDFLFHMAAQPIVSLSYSNPIETITSNVIGTANILEALRSLETPCCAVIITSDKCYDNVEWTWGYRENDPLGGKDPYSASKGAAELMVKTYFHSFFAKSNSHIRITSVRAGNVIGGGDWAVSRIVPDCIRAWVKGNAVELRNPNATRPWQHVLEPLSGYLRSAQILSQQPEKSHGEAFNFGPNADQSHTVFELLEKISSFWNLGTLKEFFVLNTIQNFHEAGLLKLNCDKALHFLNWKPVLEFNQAAEFTALWYRYFYSSRNEAEIFDFTSNQIDEYTRLATEKKLQWTQK
ncbi:CDP-glucose 4,6-dehydratase [Cytophagales bacterium WSM2-2]|nr:CDP-glucose 4,6-dehydratase [Cytophagales bacterium WSM2-2]